MHNKESSLNLTEPLRFGSTIIIVTLLIVFIHNIDCKDHRKEYPLREKQCIARFESSTGDPLYYTCPRPNEPEKKSYCCYLDKCCDFKEFQKQTEQQFKKTQALSHGYIAKGAIGNALKVLLWIVFLIIIFIIGCCCLTFFLCRKKKLFTGGIFSSPLPTQPTGPSIYAAPQNPYSAYQWPPETAPGPQPGPVPPPAYPTYPPYQTAPQPAYNPNFK